MGIPSEVTSLPTKYLYTTERKITELGLKNSSAKIIKPNSLIICTRATIGDCCINRNEVSTNQGFKSIIPNENYDVVFLYYLISNSKQKLISKASGTTFLEISKSNLANLTFNFPPLEEQKRIASALSKVDAYLENTIKLTESKERFKRAIAKKLLTCKENKNVPEARFEGFEDEWETVKLGDITRMSSGGTPNTKIKEYYNGDITWVTISDITNSYKYLYDTEKNITKLGLQNSSAKIFSINTILYAIYGSIGECAISKVECATSQAILGIECSDRINYNFLYYLLFNYKNDAKKLKQQGTQPNLNKQIVLNFHFKIPSIKEQEKIGEFLSLLDTEIDNLKKQAEGIKRLEKGLMKKLMSGEIRI